MLNSKTDTGFGFIVRVQGLCQAHQSAGIEQIHGCRKRRHGIVLPSFGGEATVFQLRVVLQALLPQTHGLLGVSRLKLGDLVGVEIQLWHGRHVLHKHILKRLSRRRK